MLVVADGVDVAVPAGATGVALASSAGCLAHESNGFFLVMDICAIDSFDWFDRYVRESRRDSDNKIARYVRDRQSLGHEASLSGCEPVFRVWCLTADFKDIKKHLGGLKIARIEPPEPALTANAGNHRADPVRRVNRGKPTLLSRHNSASKSTVIAFLRIAVLTERTVNLRKLRPGFAGACRQSECRSRHLAGGG